MYGIYLPAFKALKQNPGFVGKQFSAIPMGSMWVFCSNHQLENSAFARPLGHRTFRKLGVHPSQMPSSPPKIRPYFLGVIKGQWGWISPFFRSYFLGGLAWLDAIASPVGLKQAMPFAHYRILPHSLTTAFCDSFFIFGFYLQERFLFSHIWRTVVRCLRRVALGGHAWRWTRKWKWKC